MTVCAYHAAAQGSNPKHNIKASINLSSKCGVERPKRGCDWPAFSKCYFFCVFRTKNWIYKSVILIFCLIITFGLPIFLTIQGQILQSSIVLAYYLDNAWNTYLESYTHYRQTQYVAKSMKTAFNCCALVHKLFTNGADVIRYLPLLT